MLLSPQLDTFYWIERKHSDYIYICAVKPKQGSLGFKI